MAIDCGPERSVGAPGERASWESSEVANVTVVKKASSGFGSLGAGGVRGKAGSLSETGPLISYINISTVIRPNLRARSNRSSFRGAPYNLFSSCLFACSSASGPFFFSPNTLARPKFLACLFLLLSFSLAASTRSMF